jgi:hypothetical protein
MGSSKPLCGGKNAVPHSIRVHDRFPSSAVSVVSLIFKIAYTSRGSQLLTQKVKEKVYVKSITNKMVRPNGSSSSTGWDV